MPVNKEALEKSAITPDNEEWDATYDRLEAKKREAEAVMNVELATRESLSKSASSSRLKRAKPEVASVSTQLNEVGLVKCDLDGTWVRTMEKHKEVYNEMTKTNDGKDSKDGKKKYN